MRVVYLHGFASSPQSSKAQFFGEKFRQAGIPFVAPELDQGKFEALTVGGQLAVIERAVLGGHVAGGHVAGGHDAGGQASGEQDGRETVLMGSSLGGYLAALFAATHPAAVDRVILLAPAFNFLNRWRTRLSHEQLESWKSQGWTPIYHYGSKIERRLGHQFLEEGARYPSVPDFAQPALILHGTADEVVPADESRRFAAEHPRAKLVLFPSGHELTDVLDGLWREAAAFLVIA